MEGIYIVGVVAFSCFWAFDMVWLQDVEGRVYIFCMDIVKESMMFNIMDYGCFIPDGIGIG